MDKAGDNHGSTDIRAVRTLVMDAKDTSVEARDNASTRDACSKRPAALPPTVPDRPASQPATRSTPEHDRCGQAGEPLSGRAARLPLPQDQLPSLANESDHRDLNRVS